MAETRGSEYHPTEAHPISLWSIEVVLPMSMEAGNVHVSANFNTSY